MAMTGRLLVHPIQASFLSKEWGPPHFVIPRDEERVNIEDVAALLEGKYDEHTRFTCRFQSPDYENSQREQDFQRECEKKPAIRDIQVKPKKR